MANKLNNTAINEFTVISCATLGADLVGTDDAVRTGLGRLELGFGQFLGHQRRKRLVKHRFDFGGHIVARVVILVLRYDTHLVFLTELLHLVARTFENGLQCFAHLVGGHGTVKAHDESTSAGEIDAVTQTSGRQRYDSRYNQCNGNNISDVTQFDKVDMRMGQEILRILVREADLPTLVEHSGKDQARDEDRAKERGQDTDDQRRGKTLNRSRTEK